MFASDRHLQPGALATWGHLNLISRTEMIWGWATSGPLLILEFCPSWSQLKVGGDGGGWRGWEEGSPDRPTHPSRPWPPINVFLVLLSFSVTASRFSKCPRGQELFQIPGSPPGPPFSLGSWPSNSLLSCQLSDTLKQVLENILFIFPSVPARRRVGLSYRVYHSWKWNSSDMFP